MDLPKLLSQEEQIELIAQLESSRFSPMPGVHSEQCIKEYLMTQEAYEAWNRDYPGTCKVCRGSGIVEHVDSMEFGHPMLTYDMCECVGNRKCPRCGNDLQSYDLTRLEAEFGDDVDFCKVCGYNSNDKTQPMAPDQFECGCWAIQIEQKYEDVFGSDMPEWYLLDGDNMESE